MSETLPNETDIELACATLAGVPEGDTAAFDEWRQKVEKKHARWEELRAAFLKGVAAGREAQLRDLEREFNL